MDLLQRVEELTRLGFHSINTDSLVEIYEAVFFEKLCSTCKKDQVEAHLRLKKWFRSGAEIPTQMAKTKSKKYRFIAGKEDSQCPFPHLRLVVNAANLDEHAELMLSFPKRAALIEEIPSEEKEAKPAKAKKSDEPEISGE